MRVKHAAHSMGAPRSSSSALSWYQECGVGGKRSGSCLRMMAAASVAARTVSVALFRDCLCHLRRQTPVGSHGCQLMRTLHPHMMAVQPSVVCPLSALILFQEV